MKRIKFQVLLVIMAILWLSGTGTAMATSSTEYPNPHGVYSVDTGQCARCHTTHSALAAKLLKETNEQKTCELCHDGTMSNYNTKEGTYYNGTTWKPSLGGGFRTTGGDNFTSTHNVEMTNGAPGGLGGASMFLVCSSCHNPHGYPSTNNYRMLQEVVQGTNVGDVTAVLTKVYNMDLKIPNLPTGTAQPTDSSADNLIARKTDASWATEIPSYIGGIDQFCITCHGDYMSYRSNVTANSALYNATVGTTVYRHRMGVYMSGGTDDPAMAGDSYWEKIDYGNRPLYSTLPTLGAPTGAYVYGGSLSAGSISLTVGNSVYYIVTGINYGGSGGATIESVYGNILSIPVSSTGSYNATIKWKAIANSAGYNVYRAVGTTQPALNTFRRVLNQPIVLYDTTGDTFFSFTDTTNNISTFPTPPNLTANTGSQAKVMCLTCHYAHGTKAVVATLPSVKEPGGTITSTSDSRLLRLNNRGVCENCHKKGIW